MSASWRITEFISTGKPLISPAIKQTGFIVLNLTGARSKNYLHSHTKQVLEKRLRCSEDRGLACGYIAQAKMNLLLEAI